MKADDITDYLSGAPESNMVPDHFKPPSMWMHRSGALILYTGHQSDKPVRMTSSLASMRDKGDDLDVWVYP